MIIAHNLVMERWPETTASITQLLVQRVQRIMNPMKRKVRASPRASLFHGEKKCIRHTIYLRRI